MDKRPKGAQRTIDQVVYTALQSNYDEAYEELSPIMFILKPYDQKTDNFELKLVKEMIYEYVLDENDPLILAKEYKPDNIHFHGYAITHVSKENFRARFKSKLPMFRCRIKTKFIETPLKAIMYTVKDGLSIHENFIQKIYDYCVSTSYSLEDKFENRKRQLETQYINNLITFDVFMEDYLEAYSSFELRNIYGHHVVAYLIGIRLYKDAKARREWKTKIIRQVNQSLQDNYNEY